jgi:VCBS repeat-containing protein
MTVAVISSSGTSGSVTEDASVSGGQISTGGTLSVSDTDAGQASFQAQPGTNGAYGTFTLAADGTWTYTANNSQAAIQQLGDGQTLTETFTVKAADGTASTVTVTINGTNDVAVISSSGTTGSVTEDASRLRWPDQHRRHFVGVGHRCRSSWLPGSAWHQRCVRHLHLGR